MNKSFDDDEEVSEDLLSLCSIYANFCGRVADPGFWKAIEKHLIKCVGREGIKLLPIETVVSMFQSLAIQKCNDHLIYQHILTDLDHHITQGTVSIYQVFSVMRSLKKLSLLNATFTNRFVLYIVSKGYDSDDLLLLGNRRTIQLLCIVSQSCKNLENELFFMHMCIFAMKVYKDLDPNQLQQLYQALNDFRALKNNKVISVLRKAYL